MSNISINELSQTISELIDLDLDHQSLIESAVNRAIAAKDITGGRGYRPRPIHGCPTITNGKIACPPFVTGKIAIRPPLINGTILNPNPEPPMTPVDEPPIIINGLIAKPMTAMDSPSI